MILGHHYQRDEVIQFADFRGDSFKLSREAATRTDAEFILFCGVHFMAESADILSGPNQHVILPNLEAGCSMADMAKPEDVEACWDALAALGIDQVVPITYMNSAASIKAFCGRNGGIVCTSSNAPRVFDWAFERGERILFFPDEHLGRNTGVKKDISARQDGRLGSVPAARRQYARSATKRDGHPLEGLLLGPRPLLGRADRSSPR